MSKEVASKIIHIDVSRNVHFHIDINKFVCKRFAELEKARRTDETGFRQ